METFTLCMFNFESISDHCSLQCWLLFSQRNVGPLYPRCHPLIVASLMHLVTNKLPAFLYPLSHGNDTGMHENVDEEDPVPLTTRSVGSCPTPFRLYLPCLLHTWNLCFHLTDLPSYHYLSLLDSTMYFPWLDAFTIHT
jgi:hypothetical protein